MAIKGLAVPIIGKYSNSNGKVTYSAATVAGAAVEYLNICLLEIYMI